jgi:hypothetical protein
MKILSNTIVFFIFYVASANFKKSSNSDEVIEDEEIVYVSPKEEKTKRVGNPSEDVRNRMDSVKSDMVNHGYDFSMALKILYSNYSSIDIRISDIDYLFKKGIINENQAIMIWENLLNVKTERNLEWLGYNKLIKKEEREGLYSNKIIQSTINLFYNPAMKIQSIFTYIGGVIFYYVMKYFLKFPKLNMLFIFIISLINIINTFYFYRNKFYFTSFISLCGFINNLYFFYLSVVVLTDKKEVDYSILHTRHFKSQEHFLVKTGISSFLLVILIYISSISLRYFLNYILIFYFLEKNRDMINNYCKLITPIHLQPFDNFVCLILSSLLLFFSHLYYQINIEYSYDLNSFLIIYNSIIFYYLTSLEKFVYIQRNRMGKIFLECERVTDNRDKYELFEELKKKSGVDKIFRNENFYEGNLIDIVLVMLCCLFLFLGFYLNTYFYLLLAIFILHTIHKNCLIFLPIKISRIISNFLMLLFLVTVSNLEQLNFSYINEVIAVYDQKFLEALLLLFKLLFLVTLGICNYLSEDFVDMFNIFNYSSYRYLVKEIKGFSNRGEINKILNEVYSTKNVLEEIFEFNLAKSLDSVNKVLDSINSSGSNIEEFYIDYLMTKNTSNLHLITLYMDYFFMYANFWVLFDTFRLQNHSFFYLTFVLHKLGLFAKLCLLTFEYSKTNLQRQSIILLNIIFSIRLINYPELEESERTLFIFFFLLNVFIYIKIYENKSIMNIFLIFFNIVMLNNYSQAMPYVAISLGAIFAKNLIHYFNIRHFKIMIYCVCALNSYFIFYSLDQSLTGYIYYQIRLFFRKFLKLDFLGYLEELCFNKNKNTYSTNINSYVENQAINKLKMLLQKMRS